MRDPDYGAVRRVAWEILNAANVAIADGVAHADVVLACELVAEAILRGPKRLEQCTPSEPRVH